MSGPGRRNGHRGVGAGRQWLGERCKGRVQHRYGAENREKMQRSQRRKTQTMGGGGRLEEDITWGTRPQDRECVWKEQECRDRTRDPGERRWQVWGGGKNILKTPEHRRTDPHERLAVIIERGGL